MNCAEFKVWREFLGLPVPWVAKQIGVTPDTIRRWEDSDGTVNRLAQLMMRNWINTAQRAVGRLTVEFTESKESIQAAKEDGVWPAGWYRMIAARVAERTGLEIVWHE